MSLHVVFPEGGSKDITIPENATKPHALLRENVVSEAGKTATAFFHGGALIGRATDFPTDGKTIAAIDRAIYPEKSFPQTDMAMCCDRSRFAEFSRTSNYPEVTPPSLEKQKKMDHTHRIINNMESEIKLPFWLQNLMPSFGGDRNYEMERETAKPKKRVEQITACEEEDGAEDEIPTVLKDKGRTETVMTEMLQDLQQSMAELPHEKTNYEMGIIHNIMAFFDEGAPVYTKKFKKILKGGEIPVPAPSTHSIVK